MGGGRSKPRDQRLSPSQREEVEVLALSSICHPVPEPCGVFLWGGEGGRKRRAASAGMLQLLFSKAAPRAPGLRLPADLIRCDKTA